VPDFEKEFGVTVAYDTYESNEELVATLQTQTTGCDIVVPSAHVVPVLVAAGLLGTTDKAYLTNWDNLSPIFQTLASDPENAHTVPWQWAPPVSRIGLISASPPADWSGAQHLLFDHDPGEIQHQHAG
jgi:spermidine/putrescine-binding protein